ncbi:restriction endonuclease subunit S [Apibacter mensalis]|uniref:restriction endonuclease subunit S n=1 Tax=Apibacter mensalis TaxID=1586267 RepID=UPI0026F1FB09|nr:restriction endonuclease subunit S [Apibacter mensalis]
MESNNFIYKYLKFVSFSGLELWDTKRYIVNKVLPIKNAIYLKEILYPFKERVFKEEMIKNNWQIIAKINFSGNLFLRDFEEIHIYKGNLNLVPENAIIYSKINVRHGCIYYNKIGNVPFGVSSEYPVYLFNENIVNGEFIHKLLRTEIFKDLLNTKTTGISKARVKQDEFLNIQIPLPSLEEQNRLVENYAKKIKVAEKQEQEAVQLEHEIENYLLEELGVEKQMEEKKQPGKLIFFHLKKVDRWDVWNKKNINPSNIFLNKILDDVIIGKPMYGANVKGVKIKSDTRYIRITDINENGDLNNDFIYPEVTEKKYLLENNDFLIARSGNTVGKTFLYKKEHGKAIFAGYLVKYKLNNKVILPEYLLIFSKSKIFKDWVLANQRISGQPNINGQEFLKSPIIIPPLEKQKEIVAYITNLKNKIKKLHILAKKNREEAIKEFEQEIFNS